MIEKNEYQINDFGVVLNPTTIWRWPDEGKESLAWAFVKLTIGSDGEHWDFGYSLFSGGSPCTPYMRKFKTRAEAETAAIEWMKNHWLPRPDDLGIGNPKEVEKAKEAFRSWLSSKNQLSLF